MDCSTRNQSTEIEVKNLDHLGLVAGIIDEIGIVEIINEQVSIERGEIVKAGQVVKAIILNGLGFVSRALYLFPQFFEDQISPKNHSIRHPNHFGLFPLGNHKAACPWF